MSADQPKRSEAFDPTAFGFIEHDGAPHPHGIKFYEYQNHPAVDGGTDYLRLNLYLTQHGNYVCIWWGLYEPAIAEMEFQQLVDQYKLRFRDSYFEELFRGYIESSEAGRVILHALRIQEERYSLPQVLRGAPTDLRCEVLEQPHA